MIFELYWESSLPKQDKIFNEENNTYCHVCLCMSAHAHPVARERNGCEEDMAKGAYIDRRESVK